MTNNNEKTMEALSMMANEIKLMEPEVSEQGTRCAHELSCMAQEISKMLQYQGAHEEVSSLNIRLTSRGVQASVTLRRSIYLRKY